MYSKSKINYIQVSNNVAIISFQNTFQTEIFDAVYLCNKSILPGGCYQEN